MSAIDALRAELGIDVLLAEVQRLAEAVGQINRTQPFYTVDEVRSLLTVNRNEVVKMLADGRLWKLEGLDSTRTLIPQAAIDSLQQRPAHLRAVG